MPSTIGGRSFVADLVADWSQDRREMVADEINIVSKKQEDNIHYGILSSLILL